MEITLCQMIRCGYSNCQSFDTPRGASKVILGLNKPISLLELKY